MSKHWQRLSIVLEVALCVLLAFLLLNNRSLRQQIKVAAAHSSYRVIVGDKVGSLAVIDLAGRHSNLELHRGRSVVAVINPSCDSCAEAIRDAQHNPNAVFLSITSVEETARVLGHLNARSYVVDPKETFRKLYRGAPQIFVVDRGVVVRTCLTLRECS